MRRFLAGLGAALLVAGSAAGTHLYEARRVLRRSTAPAGW